MEQLPEVVTSVTPLYPKEARNAKIEGTVMVKALVDTKGNVAKVQVAKGIHATLDKAAMDAVKKWRFNPGRYNGKPVGTWIAVPVRFSLGPVTGEPRHS